LTDQTAQIHRSDRLVVPDRLQHHRPVRSPGMTGQTGLLPILVVNTDRRDGWGLDAGRLGKVRHLSLCSLRLLQCLGLGDLCACVCWASKACTWAAGPTALDAAVAASGLRGAVSWVAGQATTGWPRSTGGGRTASWSHQHCLCWARRPACRPRTARCWRTAVSRRSETCRPVGSNPWTCAGMLAPGVGAPIVRGLLGGGCGGEHPTRTAAAPRMGHLSQRRGGLWGEPAVDAPW